MSTPNSLDERRMTPAENQQTAALMGYGQARDAAKGRSSLPVESQEAQMARLNPNNEPPEPLTMTICPLDAACLGYGPACLALGKALEEGRIRTADKLALAERLVADAISDEKLPPTLRELLSYTVNRIHKAKRIAREVGA